MATGPNTSPQAFPAFRSVWPQFLFDVFAWGGRKRNAGSTPYTPSLDFSDARNSMYLAGVIY